MNKRKIVPLIVLDLMLIAAAVTVMVQRYRALAEPADDTPPPPLAALASPEDTSLAVSVSTEGVPAVIVPQQPRNIGFVHYNSSARRVTIIGQFNGWKPALMKKGKAGKWSINYLLKPGAYAYNFIVDNKIIIDRNNPRTRNSGRGFLSSSLTVEPLTNEPLQTN